MSRPRAEEFRFSAANVIRSMLSRTHRREMNLWRRLVLLTRGDEAMAERLVAHELDRCPWLLREEALDAARDRLQRDFGR